ncbi:hypothetical protein [Roseibium sp.]|uniref:hypothetical protein n=1 Tax=Roseibium sp. TaxID=1936156 RepID=UPI003BAE4DD5
MSAKFSVLAKIFVIAVCFIGVPLEAANAKDNKFLCSEVFRSFKSAINAHDKHLMKYAAFAKGRAFTITGMKGCGWAHGKKTQAEADRVAMKNCRKSAKNPDKCYIALRYKD